MSPSSLTGAAPSRRVRLLSLWRFLRAVQDRTGRDNLAVVAAGCAFFGMLALFPFLAALISVFGLIADPAEVSRQLEVLRGTVPDQAYQIIDDQVRKLAAEESAASLRLALSVAIALYSSTKGVKAIMGALNMIYDRTEHRGIVAQNLVALGLTAGFVIGVAVALLAVVVTPVVLELAGLAGGFAGTVVNLVRWSVLTIGLFLALAILYRIGPNRGRVRMQWMSWGALVAALTWLVASMLFSWYVASFGTYNETYGSLGAVVVLLMWFFIGAYAVLLGAEINAEVERRRHASDGPAATSEPPQS